MPYMSPPIPSTEPASLNAGDTAKWLKSFENYPASDGWHLNYILINGKGKITFDSIEQGDDHLINVLASTTAGWAAGNYDWRASVKKSDYVFTVGSGRVVVNAAFSAATLDARSQARRTLEAIESTLEGRASSATAEYEIAGRKLKYIPIPELLQLRDRLRRDVRSENTAASISAGRKNPNRIFVRFGA